MNANAVIKNDFLYVRDSEGNKLEGHRVDIGDEVNIIDISYTKQLVYLEYPTPSGTRSGYVTNAKRCIEYKKDNWLQVPYRDVFDINNKAKIGTVSNERVTILSEDAEGYNIAYSTDKGHNTKSGYIYKWECCNTSSSNNCDGSLVSAKAIDFIKSWEGFINNGRKYTDCVGVLTQGYGLTGTEIRDLPYQITEAKATELLKDWIDRKYAPPIKNNLNSKGVELKQNEFDALVSFAYNCGTGALFSSTLYRRICAGVRDTSLIENFQAWSNGGGRRLEGLYRRRTKEANMFLYGDYKGNN